MGRPKKLYVETIEDDGMWGITDSYAEASVDEVLAYVRQAVESEAIEGSVKQWCEMHDAEIYWRSLNSGEWRCWDRERLHDREGHTCKPVDVLVIPVSDDGSEP